MKRFIVSIVKKYRKILISSLLVSAFGCGIMMGTSSGKLSLKKTIDDYIEVYHHPDAEILTEISTSKSFQDLMSIDGIEDIDTRMSLDGNIINANGEYLCTRVFSYKEDNFTNFFVWNSTDTPDELDSIFVEYTFAKDNKINVGDTIKIKVDENYYDYFVSKIVSSPETLYAQPMNNTFIEVSNFGFVYIEDSKFNNILSQNKILSKDGMFNQILLKIRHDKNSKEILEKAKNTLSQIKIIDSYTYNESYLDEFINVEFLDPMKTISIFIPSVFFGIVLISIFLFVSIMVRQCRREIGILRALGVNKTKIRFIFCGVNFIMSVGAILLGTFIGICLLLYLGNYYENVFPLPYFNFYIDLKIYITSIIITLLAIQAATILGTHTIQKISPQEAFSRPMPNTQKISRFTIFLTSKLKPFSKFSAIAIIKNKFKFILSVICMSTSVIMIFSSICFTVSKRYLLNKLYEDRINYDAQIFLRSVPSQEFISSLEKLDYIESLETIYCFNTDIYNESENKKESSFINSISFDKDFIRIDNNKKQKINSVGNGIILEKHIADKLCVSKGDYVKVDNNLLLVEDISFQEVNRIQYISKETAKKFNNSNMGCIILNLKDDSKKDIMEYLTKQKEFLYIIFTDQSREKNENLFATYNVGIAILVIFSVIVGFLIVFNTAITNILDQKKKLCVLRTLGFKQSQISRNWFFQSIFQYFISALLGLPCSIFFAKFALKRLGTINKEYPFVNSPLEYTVTLILVLSYTIISHFAVMHIMKKWDIIDVVREKE